VLKLLGSHCTKFSPPALCTPDLTYCVYQRLEYRVQVKRIVINS